MAMSFTLNAACGFYIGAGRGTNEDNFCFHRKHLPIPNVGLNNPLKCSETTDEPAIFAVFDGMGGECKGAEAACLSCEIFSRESKKLNELAIPGKAFLYDCCEKANAAVNKLRRDQQLSATGSTVAALYFSQDEVVSCNIGDSKIFRIRDKKMIQISQDHTDAKILAAMGVKKKPVLLQYIGVPEDQMAIEPYITKGEIVAGDAYVLCTDGVTDVIEAAELYENVCKFEADEAVKQIVAEVIDRKGAENATVIVIKIA